MNRKIVCITDTHFGVRGNSSYFLNNQKKFFSEIFFPYIDDHKIDTIIHLGDLFDKRPTINFAILSEVKDFFLDEIKKRDIDFHIIIGNHDCTYRDTNSLNAPKILLERGGYDNFRVFEGPSEVVVKNEKLCFIPWITPENSADSYDLIKNSSSKYLFGHLEITGFQMLKGVTHKDGLARDLFNDYTYVMSGHFHHRSNEANIYYLGNPYETTWADYGNKKGFHVLDLDKKSLEFIENPYNLHIMIDKFEDVKEEKLAGKIVKINLGGFETKQIDKTYNLLDSFQNRPHTVLFFNNKEVLVEEGEVEVDTSTSTRDIIKEYVINDMKIEDESFSNYVVDLYDRASQI